MTKGKTKDNSFRIEKERVTNIYSKIQGFKIQGQSTVGSIMVTHDECMKEGIGFRQMM